MHFFDPDSGQAIAQTTSSDGDGFRGRGSAF
jgi:hypothetical protein